MNSLADWLPLATVGVTFTTLGLLKVYGFRKGIIARGEWQCCVSAVVCSADVQAPQANQHPRYPPSFSPSELSKNLVILMRFLFKS